MVGALPVGRPITEKIGWVPVVAHLHPTSGNDSLRTSTTDKISKTLRKRYMEIFEGGVAWRFAQIMHVFVNYTARFRLKRELLRNESLLEWSVRFVLRAETT